MAGISVKKSKSLLQPEFGSLSEWCHIITSSDNCLIRLHKPQPGLGLSTQMRRGALAFTRTRAWGLPQNPKQLVSLSRGTSNYCIPALHTFQHCVCNSENENMKNQSRNQHFLKAEQHTKQKRTVESHRFCERNINVSGYRLV